MEALSPEEITMRNAVALPVLAAAVLSGCFWNTTGSPNSNAGSTDSLPAVYKKFTSDVSVSFSSSDSTLTIQSDGIPNHKSPYFSATDSRYEADTESGFAKNPNSIETQSLTFHIPANPKAAATHQSTALGPIGVALNGVPLYNQSAGPNQPLTSEIYSFDQYNGHPQNSGQYHYHVEPLYLTAQNGKSSLIGFLLDGFPVYGPEENGKTLGDSDLDAYHGHFGATAEYPNGIYHYHITAGTPYINGGEFYGTPGTVTQ